MYMYVSISIYLYINTEHHAVPQLVDDERLEEETTEKGGWVRTHLLSK